MHAMDGIDIDIEARLKSVLESTTDSHGISNETLLADLSHSPASLSRYACALEVTFGIEHPFALLHGCLTVGALIAALRRNVCVIEGQTPVLSYETEPLSTLRVPCFFPATPYSYSLNTEQPL